MSEVSSSPVSPELIELLRAMTTLFPNHYPNTKTWLSKHGGQRIDGLLSITSDVIAEIRTPSSPVGQDETKKQQGFIKKDRRADSPKKRGSTSQNGHPAQLPRPVPVVPSVVWPTIAREVRQLPSPEIPAAWARAQGYGMLLQWSEQQDLMRNFAGRLGFPLGRAGPMGVLIKFEDSWQVSAGRITVSVYHPREPNPKLALVDVARDDNVVAQFELPLQLLDAQFVLALLPVEWRRGN